MYICSKIVQKVVYYITDINYSWLGGLGKLASSWLGLGGGGGGGGHKGGGRGWMLKK